MGVISVGVLGQTRAFGTARFLNSSRNNRVGDFNAPDQTLGGLSKTNSNRLSFPGVSNQDTSSPGRGRSGRSRGRPKGSGSSSGGGAKSAGKGRVRKSTAGSAAAMAGAMAGAAAASAAYGYSVTKGRFMTLRFH